jgi:hypothetical protein
MIRLPSWNPLLPPPERRFYLDVRALRFAARR